MKKLTEIEMKDLLSDYAFGKMSEYEKSIFEENLSDFPEIENEVLEIRSAFSKINQSEIKENLDKRTANISYKVNQTKYSKQRNRNLLFSLLKISVPVLLFTIGFLAVDRFNEQKQNKIVENETLLISDSDLTIAIGESTELTNTSLINKNYNFDDGLLLSPSESIRPSDIEEMSESEFNELLDELSNEKFDI